MAVKDRWSSSLLVLTLPPVFNKYIDISWATWSAILCLGGRAMAFVELLKRVDIMISNAEYTVPLSAPVWESNKDTRRQWEAVRVHVE